MLLLTLLLAASPQYPLATVFVRDGHLSLAEMGKKDEQLLKTPGIIAESASLSFSRKFVAFTGRRDNGPARLFVLTVKSGAIEELNTGLAGGHRDAVFSTDEKFIHFTASDSPEFSRGHPTRLRKWDLSKKKAVEVAPDYQPELCEFHPGPRENDVVHIESSCTGSFMLQAARQPDAGANKWVGLKVPDPNMEIATSFDGSRVVYTVRNQIGLHVFVRVGDQPEKLALTLPLETAAIQPRFACPRDVMFLKDGVPWVLDTNSLTISEASMHKQQGNK